MIFFFIDIWNWTWWNDWEDTMLYWEAGSGPSHHKGICKAFGAGLLHFCCFCELWVNLCIHTSISHCQLCPFNRNWQNYRNTWIQLYASKHLEAESKFTVTSWQCTCWKRHKAWISLRDYLQNCMTLTVLTTSAYKLFREWLRCVNIYCVIVTIISHFLCTYPGTIQFQDKFLWLASSGRQELSPT